MICPHCLEETTEPEWGAGPEEKPAPTVGDFGVCGGCFAILRLLPGGWTHLTQAQWEQDASLVTKLRMAAMIASVAEVFDREPGFRFRSPSEPQH